MADFKDISAPKPLGTMQTASLTQAGPPIDPLQRLLLYSDKEWESFIEEWASSCLKGIYKSVQQYAGSNDKGIDVAGFADDALLLGVWDNFQCKHYDHALRPTDAWPEIAKILWYSFKGDYKPPRAYYFVAPKGVGTSLAHLLGNPPALKNALTSAWDKHCRNAITSTQAVSLDGAFAAHVDGFDFSIFKAKPVREILDQHKGTSYYIARFGGGLPPRPTAVLPPQDISPEESGYVSKLLEAYSDHKKEPIANSAGLKKWSKLEQHFRRQREAFYHAESLRVFVRDKVEPGTFESLQEEIFQGVVDACDTQHTDGYACVVAVTGAAQNLPIDAHPLAPSTFVQDKHGICHQLANEDRLKWTK